MEELEVFQKFDEIAVVTQYGDLFGGDTEKAKQIAAHKAWLQSIRHERPSTSHPFKIGVYIRYFNQTKYDNYHHFNSPSPPISLVISSIRSKGNGRVETGFMASDISFMGLSSAAIRLELNAPHILQRWMIAHSPFFLTHTAIDSITPPQSAARSPGSLSRCWLDRQ